MFTLIGARRAPPTPAVIDRRYREKTMSTPDVERLRSIKTFPSLVKYLRDELDWPIESDDFDELTFDYEPEELGLDAKTAVQIKDIKQLRPLVTNQPWGIFFVNFEPKRLPVVVLRRILRSLVIKKRQSANKSQQATWNLHDLLFISSYGESDHRDITFAHFAEEDGTGDLPTLRVLGWDDEDTVLHLDHADKILREKLRWPEEKDIEHWRSRWSSAFTLRPREVIGTSKALAQRMAELATAIRKRVNKVLAVESETGPLRKLMTAFREALIHDLKEDDFADMYAQTITYGLLTARVSRPAGLVAENVADMVPITNPFLRDMLSTFLTVGGRKGKIDFDELGINDVVQALREANMEAVMRDFDDKNPQEDPVIHFYEDFLKEYDAEKRTKRGVFYTPRPVVSFIVRSVDEILRTEFGLADGLADTTTWGEMAKRHPELKIPNGAKPEDTFVQILDPACGTGTFLVEVIDLIHSTMKLKWRKQGQLDLELLKNLWNEYVSDHLLPRLYGFELMMAPYAIAHMKIGLKLFDTKYSFRSHERARIYLTNSLEPPQDFSDRFQFDAPALAHEAQAVNAVKRAKRFTVVIGNPPYSVSSTNKSQFIETLMEDYKSAVKAEKNLQPLSDDYVKFLRFAESLLAVTGIGALGLITNHAFLFGVLHRGMREHLMNTFDRLNFLDLHGNTTTGELNKQGTGDQNVFDIQQGVAITIGARTNAEKQRRAAFAELIGPREAKYGSLSGGNESISYRTLSAEPPYFFFRPKDFSKKDEFLRGVRISEVFEQHKMGIQFGHVDFATDFSRKELRSRIMRFFSSKEETDTLASDYGLKDMAGWTLEHERELALKQGIQERLFCQVDVRPFDVRWTYYSKRVLKRPVFEVMSHLTKPNVALIGVRHIRADRYAHFFASTHLVGKDAISMTDMCFVFPLYLYPESAGLALEIERRPNLSHRFLKSLGETLGLSRVETDLFPQGLIPEDIFHYAYAIFHSPDYRSRYAEFLKIDFPRLPLTSTIELFRALAKLGGELVALHLMESPKLEEYITKYAGKGDGEVAKGYPKYSAETVKINPTKGFEGVPENVWNFHIGGYQVCEKWLKDRRGRVLADEDIAHYQKIVVALKETIRLMAEIDRVIGAHGGWPGAFMTKDNA